MSADPKTGPNRRRWPRISVGASVTLSSASVQDLVTGRLQDISLGGLFLCSKKTKPIGTKVRLRIAVLAEQLEIAAKGVVVRAVTAEESARTGQAAGMGIMFTELDDRSRDALTRLLDAELGAPEPGT